MHGAIAAKRSPTDYDWKVSAMQAYRRHQQQTLDQLASDMATRIAQLTGLAISPHAVYLDHAGPAATVSLDGILFRLSESTLAIVRPCASCGLGAFASRPIMRPDDLGYALSAWRPLCRHCAPEDEDSPDW